ncbi:uncharacterized protein C9orf85 homolog [Gadus morhua]|uniref:uncharacterized protein C9orf85 homolog n=1 Tax=Gadus morhua TaxID=8049 RepID=UPI0011B6014A|nr:uncharacterized protein C9orf85 homolog [Gadus morhua]
MSSQKGNSSRSRPQKHKNSVAFRNDKYGATIQVKIANSKIHNGLCQRCKDVLEWKVKYNKYKSLTQAKKCVKCFQKNVKDAYHIMCKPCSIQLELCAKCGNKEEIVIPINPEVEEEGEQGEEGDKKKRLRKRKDLEDDDDDLSDFGSEDDDDDDDDGDDEDSDSRPRKTLNKLPVLPDISGATIKD